MRFSHNDRYLLAGSLDSALRLWSVASPSQCVKTYRCAPMTQTALQRVHLPTNVDPPSRHTTHNRGHVNERLCLASAFAIYGSGHQHVVSGSEDGRLCIWDLQSKRALQGLPGHTDAMLALAAHPREAVLATGGTSKDCSIRLWRIPELAPSFVAGEGWMPLEEEGQGEEEEVEEKTPREAGAEVGEPMDQSA